MPFSVFIFQPIPRVRATLGCQLIEIRPGAPANDERTRLATDNLNLYACPFTLFLQATVNLGWYAAAYVLPAFATIFTIAKTRSSLWQEQWTAYWLLLPLVTGVQSLLRPVFSWTGVYTEASLLVILWLILPQTKVSMFPYRLVGRLAAALGKRGQPAFPLLHGIPGSTSGCANG